MEDGREPSENLSSLPSIQTMQAANFFSRSENWQQYTLVPLAQALSAEGEEVSEPAVMVDDVNPMFAGHVPAPWLLSTTRTRITRSPIIVLCGHVPTTWESTTAIIEPLARFGNIEKCCHRGSRRHQGKYLLRLCLDTGCAQCRLTIVARITCACGSNNTSTIPATTPSVGYPHDSVLSDLEYTIRCRCTFSLSWTSRTER